MNRILISAALGLMLAGCGGEASMTGADSQSADAAPTAAVFNADSLPTVAFSVPGMMCEKSCVPEVRKILAKQPGVKDVQVVLDTKTATVAVEEGQFDAEAAIAALLDMQFEDTTLIAADASTDSADVTDEAGGVGADSAEVEASDEQG